MNKYKNVGHPFLVLFLLVISILVTYFIRNEEKEYLKEHIEKLSLVSD